ncbi:MULTISPECIES: transglycosylase SLT domain-containing protein [Cupriavidus]
MAGLSDPSFYAVEKFRPAAIECVVAAAVRRNVPANVLLAIGQHEAGTEGSAILNRNGTRDFGRTGINDKTVDDAMAEIAPFGVNRAQVVDALMHDGCYNYEMAAFVLSKKLKACKSSDFWFCAASYHSATPELNLVYQRKIKPLADQWSRYLKQHYTVRSYSRE